MARIVVFLFVVFIAGCASTQQSIENLEPGQQPAKESDIGTLWYHADKVEEQIKYTPQRIKDKELEAYIYGLVCKISPEYCADIRVYIVDIPYFNASMAPNGMMLVYSGFLLRATSEDQVAFVLGHEVGHYVLQHSIKRYRHARSLENVLLVTGLISPLAATVGSVSAYGAISAYSRDNEREADEYGIQALNRIGLNPAAGADLFSLILEEEETKESRNRSTFFASHPAPTERVEYISRHRNITEFNQHDQRRFKEIKSRFLNRWLKKEVAKRDYAGSEIVFNRLKAENVSPELVDYYLGELYRKRGEEGDLEKAAHHYEQHTRGENPISGAFKKMASVFKKLGDLPSAIGGYESYLAQNPNASDAGYIQNQIKKLKGEVE